MLFVGHNKVSLMLLDYCLVKRVQLRQHIVYLFVCLHYFFSPVVEGILAQRVSHVGDSLLVHRLSCRWYLGQF